MQETIKRIKKSTYFHIYNGGLTITLDNTRTWDDPDDIQLRDENERYMNPLLTIESSILGNPCATITLDLDGKPATKREFLRETGMMFLNLAAEIE